MDLHQGVTALLAAYGREAQSQRLLRMDYPRGDGPGSLMLANAIVVDEAMSRDFEIEVEVLSDDALIPLKAVMGKMVTVSLVRDDGTLRYFNGYVFAFSLVKTDGGFAFYQMLLKPWLAFLRLRQDCRTFQNLSLTELCDQLFLNYLQRDYQYRLLQDPPELTLAVQYNESDHNHLHRRLEAAGLLYWYEHRVDGHTLWISDDSSRCVGVDGGGAMPYQHLAGSRECDGIHSWAPSRRIGSARLTVNSYNFKNARSALAGRASLNKQGAVAPQERYEDSGAYGFKNDDDGEAMALRRMEAVDAGAQDFAVKGNSRTVQPGRTFTMSGHFSGGPRYDAGGAPRDDLARRDYLIVSAHHVANNNYQDGRGAQSSYSNRFSCLRRTIRWRPTIGFNSVDTRIYGVQTATVTGPAGEEIHTDKFGRVRLQFAWDRLGTFDVKSSPWVRVMTSWAGSGFGHISLPRIGQEVVIQFLNGHPDRPLVVGSVYNVFNMPPWGLPENRTQSGILTRSSIKGTAANANALRFEDRKGAEEVWLHAEKDQRIEVEHDESHAVGNDRHKQVGHDETVNIKHDRTETVGHDETITVGNDRHEHVGRHETIDIGGNRSEHVHQNDLVRIDGARAELVMLAKAEVITLGRELAVGLLYDISVGTDMHTKVGENQIATVAADKVSKVGHHYHIDAGDTFSITVGAASLHMAADGTITLSGTKIDIAASGALHINGKDVDVN